LRPEQRENNRYAAGETNPVGIVEHRLFSLMPSPPASVLDVGCGVGGVSLELKQMGYDVYGVDFSSIAVEKAVSKGLDAICHDVDGLGLPSEDNVWDIVWMGDILEHVFDPLYLLEEARRVLKLEGRVMISVPNDLTLRKRLEVGLFGRSPQSGVYRKLRQCKHHTVISRELLLFFLQESGFCSFHIEADVKFPFVRKQFWLSNPVTTQLFGKALIVVGVKSKTSNGDM